MKTKNINIAGIVFGSVTAIVGIIVILAKPYYFGGYLTTYEFGADFYTEIYNASYKIFQAIDSVGELLVEFTNYIGIALIVGGIAIILISARNMVLDIQREEFLKEQINLLKEIIDYNQETEKNQIDEKEEVNNEESIL